MDAVIFPTWNNNPLMVGRGTDGYDGNNSPMIAPHTGAPAITVPMGTTGGWVLICVALAASGVSDIVSM